MSAKKNILPILIGVLFLILASYSLGDDILYNITKKVAPGQITAVKKIPATGLYQVYLTYYNDYTQSIIEARIGNVESYYGARLKITGTKNIYYRKYFPTEVYFTDYKAPTVGKLINSLFWFILVLAALYVLFKY